MNTAQLLLKIEEHEGSDLTELYLDNIHWNKLSWFLNTEEDHFLGECPFWRGFRIYKVDTPDQHIQFY